MPKPSDKPTTAKTNKIRQYLRNAGMSNADAQRLVKTSMTLSEIGVALSDDLRQRPKGGK